MADSVWCCVDERFPNAMVVNTVLHGGSWDMVWTGISYGQRTQVHFIDGSLREIYLLMS